MMSIRKVCRTALVLAALILPLISHSASASVLPLTDRQLAAGSPHVVVAVVEEARSRWNGTGTLIVTDYDLRIEDHLKGDAPGRVTLTVPGGTVGGETHATSVSTPLATGARYLLFLGDLERSTFTPVTGGWQGVFREAGGAAGQKGFSAAVRTARAVIMAVAERPEPADTAWLATVEDPALPAKDYDRVSAKFVVRDPAVPPIVINPMPPGSPFSQQDVKMLAYWNVYARGLFHTPFSPSTTWSFGNGQFDIAGFPTEAQMQRQFQTGWGGVLNTVFWRIQNGHIIEADLAFNPAFSWTVNDDASTRPNGPLPFKSFLLRGLGLAWGYQGLNGLGPGISLRPVSRDSIAHGKAPQYDLPTLFAEDAQAIRATYPGTSIRDGLISSYSVLPFPIRPRYVPVVAGVSSARPGSSFNLINPVKIENPGTEDLADPSVDVYLVPKRFSLGRAIFLKRVRLSGTLHSGEARNVTIDQITLPGSVPAGAYYFAFVLRVPGDRYLANNSAWSNYDVRITVKP